MKVGLFLAIVGAGGVAAETVYVNCEGSGNNAGTEADPYTSLEKASSHELSAGDTLAFKRGSTCKGVLRPKGSGTEGNPIHITSYGDGDLPVINGQGAKGPAVSLVNQDYVKISSISVTNPAESVDSRQGINISATDNKPHYGITVDSVTVTDVAGQTNKATNADDFVASGGIVLGGLYNDVLVTGCSVSDCGGGGIKIRPGYGQGETLGQNIRVAQNDIKDCGGDGIIVSYAERPVIEHNVAGGLGTGKYPYTGGNFAGMWVLGSHDSTIQYNVVHDSIMSVADSQAFDCDWGNTGYCLVQYNFARDNAGGIFLNCDGCGGDGPKGPEQIVRYNIFQNDCRMSSTGDEAKLSFYNNVVYCPKKDFEIELPPQTNMTNNIFVGSGSSNNKLPTGDNISWLWNVFHNVDKPTDNGIVEDPKFSDPGTGKETLDSANGYKLKSDSPALKNGAIIPNNGGKDFFGNKVSTSEKPNRGAYNGEPV
ncbi:hypothetical protein TRICI_002019 [Trichomonascus ciferrii]|uniref:Right handed beta helix domain-containing protein n=1 Tax=Trichomonascus ciferrii TaxID=44093 RepID=A0A642V7Y1_9ASCO|nr:hypothetical protein TRICI_002019 [Trichomonascus ciferrii]